MDDLKMFFIFMCVAVVVIFTGLGVEEYLSGDQMKTCVQSGQQWKENDNHKMECVK